MAIKVDNNAALAEMIESLERVKTEPCDSCLISDAIETVMGGTKCLTYQYILLTALVAKSANPEIDMLALQVDDNSSGAYAPRQLCKEVVYPFQKDMLDDALDGANNDPLVNKPGRFLRLSKGNQARGDGKAALYALCDSLPLVDTQSNARKCLDYTMTRLLRIAAENKHRQHIIENSVKSSCATDLRIFLSDLLDQGFGGDALVLVTSALYRIQYPVSDGYSVVPHPVNQPGSSSRQCSDLDLLKDDVPVLGTELKDKPFTVDDVRRAASTAAAAGVPGVLFVSGRSGNFEEQTRAYFETVRGEFADKGVYVGLCGIDALMDIVLTMHRDLDAPSVLKGVYKQVRDNAGTPEAQMWIYSRLSSMSK